MPLGSYLIFLAVILVLSSPDCCSMGGVPLDVENREALFRSPGRVVTVARG
jgi:hypothetical protein